jgi:hypothetical protein
LPQPFVAPQRGLPPLAESPVPPPPPERRPSRTPRATSPAGRQTGGDAAVLSVLGAGDPFRFADPVPARPAEHPRTSDRSDLPLPPGEPDTDPLAAPVPVPAPTAGDRVPDSYPPAAYPTDDKPVERPANVVSISGGRATPRPIAGRRIEPKPLPPRGTPAVPAPRAIPVARPTGLSAPHPVAKIVPVPLTDQGQPLSWPGSEPFQAIRPSDVPPSRHEDETLWWPDSTADRS